MGVCECNVCACECLDGVEWLVGWLFVCLFLCVEFGYHGLLFITRAKVEGRKHNALLCCLDFILRDKMLRFVCGCDGCCQKTNCCQVRATKKNMKCKNSVCLTISAS